MRTQRFSKSSNKGYEEEDKEGRRWEGEKEKGESEGEESERRRREGEKKRGGREGEGRESEGEMSISAKLHIAPITPGVSTVVKQISG